FTIEPMVNAGKAQVKELNDGWTVVTQDKSLSAQWEHINPTSSAYPAPTASCGGANSDAAPVTSTQNLTARASKLFAITEKESLAEERKFTRSLSEKGDMHVWMNTYALYSSSPQFSSMSMMNLTKIYEGSFFAGTAIFEKGQIIGNFRSYSGKELTNIVKKYSGKGIEKDMVNKLNGDNLAALYFMNFKPEGVKALFDLMGMTGLANIGLAMAGLTIDDVVKGYLDASPKTISVWDKLSGSAVGGFADLQYIMKNIPVSQMDSGKVALYNLNLAMWQDAYLTGGKFKNGAFEQHFEINLLDKNTNSLKQMNDFFSKLAEIEKKNKTLTEGFETLQDSQQSDADTTISSDTIQ
ncbi:MAG: DUF4836 family protein, partial [Chitinophagaceae bacterium]